MSPIPSPTTKTRSFGAKCLVVKEKLVIGLFVSNEIFSFALLKRKKKLWQILTVAVMFSDIQRLPIASSHKYFPPLHLSLTPRKHCLLGLLQYQYQSSEKKISLKLGHGGLFYDLKLLIKVKGGSHLFHQNPISLNNVQFSVFSQMP